MGRQVISFIAAVAVAYALGVGALFAFQRDLLYPASQFRPAPAQFGVPEMQTVTAPTER